MIYYSLFTYSLMCVAFIFTILSFIKKVWGISFQFLSKIIIGIVVFVLVSVNVKYTSISLILYNIFDIPSFLLFFICLFSILRNFISQVGFIISYKGFLFLFVMWLVFILHMFGIFDFFYGSLNYKILIVFLFIGFAYCIDRICGLFMFLSVLMWIPFSNTLDIYNIAFDSIVSLCGFLLQSIPPYKNNFHVALLKPKFK